MSQRDFYERQIEFSKNEIRSHYEEIERLNNIKGREKNKAEMIALRQEWIKEERSQILEYRNQIDLMEK